MDLESLRQRLPGRMIEWVPSTESTMLLAAERVQQGFAHGTILGADLQTAGIGRHGKQWHSAAGEGLYVSIILRLGMEPDKLPIVMLALGLAARSAIGKTSGIVGDLRWPNDVLVGGKKIAGILAKVHGKAIVAGIGINVTQSDFPPNLETPATSLSMEGAIVSREDLLVALTRAIEGECEALASRGNSAILNAFSESSSYTHGLRVRVEAGDRVLEGVTCGLDSSGFLQVREDSGTVATVVAGGVRPV